MLRLSQIDFFYYYGFLCCSDIYQFLKIEKQNVQYIKKFLLSRNKIIILFLFNKKFLMYVLLFSYLIIIKD